MSKEGTYHVQQFAALAGVTVRTLHYYDRLDLLKAFRTSSGYRFYTEEHLERLEQIVALKFLGLPLKQIQAVLDRDALDLPAALLAQRSILEERRQQLDRAILAIREAESALKSGQRPNAALLKKIIELLEMEDHSEWLMKHYSEDARKVIRERGQSFTQEQQKQVAAEWQKVIHDIDAAAEGDPASPEGQRLAERWLALIESFTGGNAQVVEGLSKVYADRANWPESFANQMKPYQFKHPQADAFIRKAIVIRKQSA